MGTALTAMWPVGGVLLLLGNGVFVTTEFAMTPVRQFPVRSSPATPASSGRGR
jgi:hypothetical protein